jgi:hypothetical protein
MCINSYMRDTNHFPQHATLTIYFTPIYWWIFIELQYYEKNMTNVVVSILFPILTAHILGWHGFHEEMKWILNFLVLKTIEELPFFFVGKEITSVAYLWKVLNSSWADSLGSGFLHGSSMHSWSSCVPRFILYPQSQ